MIGTINLAETNTQNRHAFDKGNLIFTLKIKTRLPRSSLDWFQASRGHLPI